MTGRDTIAELVPDRRFAYTHTSNLPVRDYREIPGTGWLMRRALDGFVAGLVNGIAEHAAATETGRPATT